MNPIPLEQAVYGSFPFWDRGYALLAHSPGCRPEWLEAFTSACSRFGDRPRDVNRADALFTLPLPSGAWMIVAVREQGDDDQGRPGALAFHALFVSDAHYRQSGASPFAFAPWHQSSWGPDTTSLPTLSAQINHAPAPVNPDPRAARIALALSRGRRVAIVADNPIDTLAQDAWNALPPRLRARKTVSTWTFSTQNGFDLVGLPHRPNLTTPSGYTTESALIDPPARSRPLLRSAALLSFAIALSALAGAWYIQSGDQEIRDEPTFSPPVKPAPPPPSNSTSIDPETRRKIGEKLRHLAHRFDLEPATPSIDPPFWMRQIAGHLRYHGPLLSPADLARLRRERSPGRSRALEWDAQIRRFLPDRPLPDDFDRQPLGAQLSALTWSFHLDLDPRLTPTEIPDALAYALSIDGPTRPNPLTGRYPPLLNYAQFLDRLPRR